MHLITALCNVAKRSKNGGDLGEGDQRIEARHDNLGRRARPTGSFGVVGIRFEVIRSLAQARAGVVKVDINIVEPSALGQARIRGGSVIFVILYTHKVLARWFR